jgi:ABC-type Fe3+ transport system substrate-binding protein
MTRPEPPELQDAVAFTWAMGACANADEPDAARALVRYLMSLEAGGVIEAKGMAAGAAP